MERQREDRELAAQAPRTRREARELAAQTPRTRRQARELTAQTPRTRREARELARRSARSSLPRRIVTPALAAAVVTACASAAVLALPSSVTAGTSASLATTQELAGASLTVAPPVMIVGRGSSVAASRGSTPRLSLAWGVAAAAEGRRTMSTHVEAIRSSVAVGVDTTEGGRSLARELASAGAFHEPILSGHQTSGFGWRWGRMHNGIDYGAPTGTPLYAVGGGAISAAGWNSGLGYHVKLALDSGEVIVYGHLSQIGVEAGERVRPGTPIGEVGSTGRSTGSHLHLEVRTEQGAVDPLPWLAAQRD